MVSKQIYAKSEKRFACSCAAVLLLLFCSGYSSTLKAELKMAVVIGNSNYESLPLSQPLHDAPGVAGALREIGFTLVTSSSERHLTDLTAPEIYYRLRILRKKMNPGGIALFYFSGYAVQHEGKNYLAPLATKAIQPSDIPKEFVALRDVINLMQESKSKANLIVLDATRKHPYLHLLQPQKVGLAYEALSDDARTLILYSMLPNREAPDNSGSSYFSIFSSALCKNLRWRQFNVAQMVEAIKHDVVLHTSPYQIPFEQFSNDFQASTTYLALPVYEIPEPSLVEPPNPNTGLDTGPAPQQAAAGATSATVSVEGDFVNSPQEIKIQKGDILYRGTPSISSPVSKRYEKVDAFSAAGYVDRPEGRFWISKWSYEQWKKRTGQQNWLYKPKGQ